MKTYIVIPLVLTALAAVLYLSDRYDRTINQDEIEMYQCEQFNSIPFFISESDTIKPKGNYEPLFIKKGDRLTINNSNIQDIPKGAFENLPCLNSINLNHNLFKTIPSELQNLNELRGISFKRNKLTTLSTTTFNRMYRLNTLDFSSNPIKALTIPRTSSYLQKFNCNYCQLESIDTIYSISIRDIQLEGNNFDEFPLELLEVNGMEILNLFENNIKSFDFPKGQISSLFYTRLNELNLAKNQLTKFPEGVYRFPNLQRLDLNGNQISGELNIKGLFYLKQLDITQQNLTSVFIDSVMYNNFGEEEPLREFLPSTGRIDLSSNKIEKFTILGKENNLTYNINLRNNHFKEFPNSLYKFKALRELDLSGNQIEKLVIENAFTQDFNLFDLSNNQISEVINNGYRFNNETVGYFDFIDLSHNRLTEIPGSFVYQISLKALDLSHNNINSMKVILPENSFNDIETLNLSHNPIKKWDNSIKKLHFLKHLDLSNTDIEYIPFEDIEYMSNMETLTLKNTKIPEKLLRNMKSYLEQFDIEVIY